MTRDEQEIRAEIEQVRHDLGQTVEALAYKADLPARARQKRAELTARARARVRQVHQLPGRAWLGVAGGLAALVALLFGVRMLRSR
jgi:type VI protein secretion system component VasF